MAFVPGFDHDVFISYAHGDDRDWINRFLDRLEPALSRRLPGTDVWIDKDDLRKSRNFEKDIPANLDSSAVLISLVSPTYIGRPYCVKQECRRFSALAARRKEPKQAFAAPEFSTELFGFRCPILPMPDTAYRDDIFRGATDIAFCDDLDPFPIVSSQFEDQFRLLLRSLVDLLRRMRNQSTPVLVYPRLPAPELAEPHDVLTRELHAQSYRVLPEDELDPTRHVPRCELGVLLLGQGFDETTRRLADEFAKLEKPFVVWPSPAVENAGDFKQRGFIKYLDGLEFGRKTLLAASITPEKLKEELFARLNPRAKLPPPAESKPRVYLIYDDRRKSEKDNAGQIVFHYHDEFHFEYSDNPRQHSNYLTQSDGVLLVWGEAGEEWCAEKFEQMVRLASQPRARGLCLFDPQESKLVLAEQVRMTLSAIHVTEQFGQFDPARLEPFFAPLRKAQGGTA